MVSILSVINIDKNKDLIFEFVKTRMRKLTENKDGAVSCVKIKTLDFGIKKSENRGNEEN